MPTPRLSDEAMREAVDLWRAHGQSIRAAADASGMGYCTYKSRLEKAKREGFHLTDGVRDSVAKAGLDFGLARGGHRRVYDEETGRQIDTVRYTIPQDAIAEDALERIRGALEGMQPAEPVTAPERVADDLLTVYPVMDLHLGMQAWGRETGGPDYDLKTATSDIQYAFEKVLSLTPQSSEAVLILGGDTLHADDDNAQTPQSKHALDVDGRQFKVIEQAIKAIAYITERLAQRHARLTVRVLRGNHDLHAHTALTFALAERYRNDDRITVEKDPRDMFMRQWGKSAIFANHGDRMKPQQMVNLLCDICPFWSSTRHRYALTGHIHHDSSKDFGALRWESLRAFCPPDSYAASMGYPARRALQALTFDKVDGLVLRAIDPIERVSA